MTSLGKSLSTSSYSRSSAGLGTAEIGSSGIGDGGYLPPATGSVRSSFPLPDLPSSFAERYARMVRSISPLARISSTLRESTNSVAAPCQLSVRKSPAPEKPSSIALTAIARFRIANRLFWIPYTQSAKGHPPGWPLAFSSQQPTA